MKVRKFSPFVPKNGKNMTNETGNNFKTEKYFSTQLYPLMTNVIWNNTSTAKMYFMSSFRRKKVSLFHFILPAISKKCFYIQNRIFVVKKLPSMQIK